MSGVSLPSRHVLLWECPCQLYWNSQEWSSMCFQKGIYAPRKGKENIVYCSSSSVSQDTLVVVTLKLDIVCSFCLMYQKSSSRSHSPQQQQQQNENVDSADFEMFAKWALKHHKSVSFMRWLLGTEPGTQPVLSDNSDRPTFYQIMAGITKCKCIWLSRTHAWDDNCPS